MIIEFHFTSAADWIQASFTILLFFVAACALFVAYRQLRALRESSDHQRLSTFLDEISGDEASYDRGLVRSRISIDAEVSVIKNYVSTGRLLSVKLRHANLKQTKPVISERYLESGLIGIAIEKTLVRYDRVALFILDTNERFRTPPPDWLLNDVNMIWSRLYNWIYFRRKTDDLEYRNVNFAQDLEGLYRHPRTNELRNRDNN